MSINYLFYPSSHLNNMVGSHLPGDPYFPNQGNGGWTDAKPEVNNLPMVAPIPNPNPRPGFQGPTPLWAANLKRWSPEQDQPLPYNGD